MRRRVIVLKIGGSVLTDEGSLDRAAQEVFRWRRAGWRVVVVPSAIAGDTDRRLAEVSAGSPRASSHAVAGLLANGEQECAAQLVLRLDRAGVPARAVSPAALGLLACGDALDGEPEGLDARLLDAVLDDIGVVVVPGFTAVDEGGAFVTLGRGGSDLSALFIADRLGADRCRLVKDVDGLFERDPALPGPPPALFSSISWDDALRLDGSIVQHKAVRFARSCGLRFEVARLGAAAATEVGPGPSRLASPPAPRPRLTVALLGLGTVGRGVYEALRDEPEIDVIAVAVSDLGKPRPALADGVLVFDEAIEAASLGADVVVEAIGGEEPARSAIAAAIRAGSHVVTANKAVLAEHGRGLQALATLSGRRIIASASVGGAVPILERLRSHDGDRPVRVRGILNGTANFVLDRLRLGDTLDEAVARARALGLAEADPTRDLDGRDAADKLAVIAQALGFCDPRIEVVARGPLGELAGRSHAGSRVRQVATLEIVGGEARGRVGLEALGANDPLCDIHDEWNAVDVLWPDGRRELLTGRGAGRWPTALSVVGDVLEISRASDASRRPAAGEEALHVA